MLRHQSFLGNYAYAARGTAVPCPSLRLVDRTLRTRVVPTVVSLQPCRAARYACVACRGLGWYLALVALANSARYCGARNCGSRRATTARHYDTLPRQAVEGTRLAAHGSRRIAASRVSFFCVSRAAVLTCFDGDVNSLVSLQGRRNQGAGEPHAPTQFLTDQVTLSQPGGRLCPPY